MTGLVNPWFGFALLFFAFAVFLYDILRLFHIVPKILLTVGICLLTLYVLWTPMSQHVAQKTENPLLPTDVFDATKRGVTEALKDFVSKPKTEPDPTKSESLPKPLLEKPRLKEKVETKVLRKSEQTLVEKQKPESPIQMAETKQQIPLPPPHSAQLLFSFPFRNRQDIPVAVTKVPLRDGVAKVDFMVVNLSEMSAIAPEIWVRICIGCTYAKEPEGFLKLPGADEHDRYKSFNALNPSVALQMMTVEIIPPKEVKDRFQISFKYACQTCGVVKYWQTFEVFLER